MSSNELAQKRRIGLRQRVMRAVGPAGVFFKGFLREPRMVGSVIPSSRSTIDAMLEPVDWANCKLFVEYGPGVGTFCQSVLDRLPRDGELLVIDTNPLFIDYLKRAFTDSRFHAVLGSAADVEEIVRMIGHEKADYVLSGLPFSTLPEGVGQSIVEATSRVVREGGAFMTYQFKGVARDLTARYFPRVTTDMAWFNIPPCILAWGWQTSGKSDAA
ncbi:class I SAM-dependent methyltransferase [Aurantiacibacter gangjinensis]|uniref:Methyltransferase n=1 Tax=Aurantiacibacter gangjinensis TaxID=502682 RepID=A0A0G9MK31_9SPHN|nr:methyltransferase [Aurantiacibacter gangjinensis]APE29366.1 Ribosomal RNA adenine dimethylase domain protein [Aurantiacibacter gangjinensis]KLE31057.1 methyltransferase [Aurantiacibacter gangjinensis]